MPRVLIVEDDTSMAAALKDGFEYEGHSVMLAQDGVEGLRLATESAPDLIVLDVMLPRMSGLDVCKQIRSRGNRVPIIMLTARGQEIDKVLGLRTGADDYVTKPFGFMELMARVEALLRRSQGVTQQADAYRFGDVEVDFARCEARKAGGPLELSARELRLLQYFVEHRGEVLDRDRLLSAVWGYESDSYSRTVDVHVAKLRRKIEDRTDDPRHIVTVHGVGYKFTG
jgi:two-component system alkaline phosphatase synthesis response regulator PhoP